MTRFRRRGTVRPPVLLAVVLLALVPWRASAVRGGPESAPEGTNEIVEAIKQGVGALGASRVEVLAPNPGGANLTLVSPEVEAPGATLLSVSVMVGTRDPRSAEAQYAARLEPSGSKQWRRHGTVELAPGAAALLEVYERRGQSWQGHATSQWRGSFFRGVAFCEFTARYVAPAPVARGEDAKAAQVAWAAACAPRAHEMARRLYDAFAKASPAGRDALEVTLVDPNPVHAEGGLRYTAPFAGYFWQASARAGAPARGACADGASLLLVRVRVPSQGRVHLSVGGDGDVGGLIPLERAEEPLSTPVAATLDVDAVLLPEPGGYGALALYRPPRDFGAGKGPRTIRLSARYDRAGAAAPPLEGTALFKLLRPPVVLVHGTYDNPKDCWQTRSPGAPPGHVRTMEECLRAAGFRTFLVDYGATSGKAYASSPDQNAPQIWFGNGGIYEALTALRKEGFAATRADLVCHSLGGVLGRHYVAQGRGATETNYRSTDVNRLVTLCSTHRGSEVVGLFAAYDGYQTSTYTPSAFWISFFLTYVDRLEERITSQAPMAQIPGSEFLRGLGATKVRAHAIACVAADADLAQYGGLYAERARKLWEYTPREAIVEGIGKKLGHAKGAAELLALADAERTASARVAAATIVTHAGSSPPPPELVAELAAARARGISALRRIAFDGPNDCTVSEVSAKGGLEPPFATTIQGVLHGFAPQYPDVQRRVVELLESAGDGLFAPKGFPAAYP